MLHLTYTNKTLTNTYSKVQEITPELEQGLLAISRKHGVKEFMVRTHVGQSHYRVYGDRVGLVNVFPLDM